MRRLASAAPLSLMLLLPMPALPQHRGLDLQATPRSPLLPVPPTPPAASPGGPGTSYDVAPTPNRDLDAPAGPRARAAPELAPGFFPRGEQYRGDGYSSGSSAQAEQERRVRPGAGFKLRLPLQQQ